jgi:hypothetical protein
VIHASFCAYRPSLEKESFGKCRFSGVNVSYDSRGDFFHSAPPFQEIIRAAKYGAENQICFYLDLF